MKTEIFFSPAYLLKGEVPGVVNGVVAIVERRNPVALGVEPFFNLLLEGQSQLTMFSNNAGSHPLTEVILNDRSQVISLANSIELQFRGVEKGKIGVVAGAVLLVKPAVKQLVFLYNLSSKIAGTRVDNFLALINADELMRAAATTLGFDMYIGEIKLVKQRIVTNIELRRQDLAKRRISNRPVVKVNVLDAITNLLKAIELAKVQFPATDYLPLITELNELFVPYRAVGRSRSTRNMNEALKNEIAAMSTITSATAN